MRMIISQQRESYTKPMLDLDIRGVTIDGVTEGTKHLWDSGTNRTS